MLNEYRGYRVNNSPNDSFAEVPLILHFSYHKCLTAYYQRIMRRLGREFYFKYDHYTSKAGSFNEMVSNPATKGAFSVNNRSDIQFDSFNDFRGSHFTRDPRDLLVSGFKYHLWTHEKWAHARYPWGKITSSPFFDKYIDIDPGNKTYQEYINSLDKEHGMILEMIWRKEHFDHMLQWNYNNPKIIELKYEEIVGNEIEAFNRVFDHYQLSEKMKVRGLKFVDELSLKNVSKTDKHVQHGGNRQWESHFNSKLNDIFQEMYPDFPEKVGYPK